jgi:hypothetical protein
MSERINIMVTGVTLRESDTITSMPSLHRYLTYNFHSFFLSHQHADAIRLFMSTYDGDRHALLKYHSRIIMMFIANWFSVITFMSVCLSVCLSFCLSVYRSHTVSQSVSQPLTTYL